MMENTVPEKRGGRLIGKPFGYHPNNAGSIPVRSTGAVLIYDKSFPQFHNKILDNLFTFAIFILNSGDSLWFAKLAYRNKRVLSF